MSILKNKTVIFLFLACFSFMNISPGFSDSYKLQNLVIDHAYAFATSSKNGAAYFHIKNQSDSSDELTGATSPIAKKTSLHQHIHEDNIVKMRPVASISIPANGKILLKPGGYHVMLMGLQQPLDAGKQFPLQLTFKKSGTIDILVDIADMRKGHNQ